MNKRRFQRAILLTGFIGLLLTGGYGLRLFQVQRHQYTLNRQLISALMKRDTSQALLLVNEGADPNTPHDPPSAPSLKHFLEHLLHRSALPEPENTSPTAFLIACGWFDPQSNATAEGQEEPQLVEAMLRHRAKCNMRDKDGWTPLFWAILAGHPETVGVLLDHGADGNVRFKNERMTPLMIACDHASARSVRLLLDHNADVNTMDDTGATALFYAVNTAVLRLSSSQPKDADILLKDIVPQMLAHGANPTLTDGWTSALQCATGHPEIVTLLRRYGAKK